MLHLVVCIKQVPTASELPWDPRSRTLKRFLSRGMINPPCRHALETALVLKQMHQARITVISMGPPMAEEALYEALAMGADKGILLTDPKMAGADTLVTSFTLARAIEQKCPDLDIVLCGCHSIDSETAQVGPQLSEALGIPGVSCVEALSLQNRTLRMKRVSDDYMETLEMDLPGLVTVTTRGETPRYVSMGGIEKAFDEKEVKICCAEDLGLSPVQIGAKASPTRILRVYSPTAGKDNLVLKGAVKKIAEELFSRFGDRIGGAMGKDLRTPEHDTEDG